MPSLSTSPAAIDSPDMRTAGRELLSLALMDARNHTLHLLAQFEQAASTPTAAAERQSASMHGDPREETERPSWLAGHIGWFAEYWIGRNTQRSLGRRCSPEPTRLASIDPGADRWWNPAQSTRARRWEMNLPDAPAIRAYLLDTLESTLELLEKSREDDDPLYFYRLALFHEDLRGEQLMAAAQSLGIALRLNLPGGIAMREPLLVPATRWLLGSPGPGFSFDNERPAHEVNVPEFEIDAQPVSWAQFVEFVDDGGYDRSELWLPQGWEWLEEKAKLEGRRAPRHVEQIGVASGAVMQTRFGRASRMSGSQSAMHVSWWEAEAWARWAGRRLPTEVEWEVAAHTAQRRGFRWGDVWDWTAGTLRPWPGFKPDPWDRQAQAGEDGAYGSAKVLRGASFATRARMKHPKYRGFAAPQRDDLFVGFRTCAL